MITVFVSGAGGGVGQGIIKSLKLIDDLDIRIIAADMGALSAGLYTADRCYLIPKALEEGYVDYLLDIFCKESIDFYFPGTDVELLKCAENAVYIKNKSGTTVVVSPYEAIELSDDKYLTYEFLEQNDLYAPASFLPSNLPESIDFPIIVKPRIGCRSIGVSIANNIHELNARLEAENGLMVQELVGSDDEEYTCTVAAVNGKVSDALILRRTLRSGDTFQATPVQSTVISEYVRKIALLLHINGSCNFQLRLADGIPKIFEINCRFSGTTPFCSQLGFNPVEFYLKAVLDKSYQSSINYDAIVLRHWTESVIDIKQYEALQASGSLDPIKPLISNL